MSPTNKTNRRQNVLPAIFHVRVSEDLKARVSRLANHRQCQDADIVRESIVRHCEEEEQRFGMKGETTTATRKRS